MSETYYQRKLFDEPHEQADDESHEQADPPIPPSF